MEITKLFVKWSVLLFENTDTGQDLVDTESNQYNFSLVQRF